MGLIAFLIFVVVIPLIAALLMDRWQTASWKTDDKNLKPAYHLNALTRPYLTTN